MNSDGGKWMFLPYTGTPKSDFYVRLYRWWPLGMIVKIATFLFFFFFFFFFFFYRKKEAVRSYCLSVFLLCNPEMVKNEKEENKSIQKGKMRRK